MQLPDGLTPTSSELIRLSTNKTVRIPKATPEFRRWRGAIPPDTYGGKAIVEAGGAPAFVELAILRLLEADGWDGVWIDTYRNKFRRGYWDVPALPQLPPRPAALLQRILDHRDKGRSGTWDIFAWRGKDVLFAESKRRGKDAIRPTQITWLAAALAQGHPEDAFLVVEWSLG